MPKRPKPHRISTIFRGGDFNQWLDSTFRMALTILTFKRRNYDKATLCQLSDILYHSTQSRDLVDNIKLYLNVFTEKKVEVFHSVLRRFVENKNKNKKIQPWAIILLILFYEFIILRLCFNLHQGLTNIRPGRPGQVEKFSGQVFHSSKKPTGPSHLTKKVILHNQLESI